MKKVYNYAVMKFFPFSKKLFLFSIFSFLLPASFVWAVVFPVTSYLSSTVDSTVVTGTTSWQIVTAAPSVSTVVTSVTEGTTVAYFQWQPGASNTTSQASAPTSPDGKGFIYDTALNSIIPSGTWTFNVQVQNSASNATSVGHVVVCAWKVTVKSGAITNSVPIFACQEGATNVTGISSTSLKATSVAISGVAAQNFNASQYIYVEYWLRQTTSSGSTTFKTTFQSNAGAVDDIVLPGASAAQSITFSLGSSVLNLGALTSGSVKSGSNTVAVGTNAVSGMSLAVYGTTLAYGTNTITACATGCTSTPGTSQFGINLVANTAPSVGAAPSGTAPIGTVAANYGTANTFRFVSGDTIASSAGPINTTTYTVSYMTNIANTTQAGSYSTTLTYTASATF